MSLVTAAFSATHVTGTYDLGANPRVMTTVNGNAEYGLVFAQRNKAVTYNSIEYGPSVVKGYLNSSGELNDGAGNLWLDLIPNLTATPADSYYVVTFNIQGRVHAEIWVVPDVASVAVEAVRQTQPPGVTGSALDLANATGLLSLAHGGTNQSSWTAARCVRVNNLGNALESAPADCGSGGGSAPLASATVSGTVKTDATESNPVVYLRSSADTLLAGKASSVHTHSENDVTNLTTDLAGKVPATRSVSTSSPLSGGGALSSDLTLSCPTCEVTGNKNAASGYAGLTASTKLSAAQGQEVWSVTDLSTYASTSGSGTTAIQATITSPSTNDVLAWNGSNWINQAPSGGSNHNLLSATHTDTVAASPVLGDMLYGNATPAWTKLAGNTATTKKFLNQTGTGSASAAPQWDGIADGDLPSTITRDSEINVQGTANEITSSGSGPTPTISLAATLDLSGKVLQGASPLVFEGATANNFETSVAVTDPTADRTLTIPNADSVAVQPQTCSGTDKVSAVSTAGVITCSADQTGAGSGDNISVNGAAATDADFDDATPSAPANAINVKWQKDTGTPNNLSAYIPYASPLTVASGNLTSSFTASSSDTLTNKTLDAEATGNSLSYAAKFWLPAAGCNNATAAPAFDLPTSNAPAASCYGTSPHRFGGLDFADGSSALTAATHITLPADWTSTGGVDVKFIWFSGSTSTNSAVWTLQTVCVADAEDVLNPGYNSAQTVADANNASANTRNSASLAGVTTTGCAAGETMWLKLGRDPTNASDTLAATAVLLGVEVTARRAM